jgi:hypothetical protein
LVGLEDRKEDPVPDPEKVEPETAEETTGLSDEEVLAMREELERLKTENAGLKLSSDERAIKDQIKGWQDEKFSPAILTIAEEVLLGEVTAEGVNLSSDGKEETVTVGEIVKRLVEASPKIELDDAQVTDADSTGDKPKEEAEEVELAEEVQDRARELFLHHGKTSEEALAQAQAEFDAKNDDK